MKTLFEKIFLHDRYRAKVDLKRILEKFPGFGEFLLEKCDKNLFHVENGRRCFYGWLGKYINPAQFSCYELGKRMANANHGTSKQVRPVEYYLFGSLNSGEKMKKLLLECMEK